MSVYTKGVTQRVITETRKRYHNAPNPQENLTYGSEAQDIGNQILGMCFLADNLSDELRSIFTEEVENPSDNSRLYGDKLYVRISHVADRLGLDFKFDDEHD